MSLINRLLKDLDSRLAGQSEELAISPHARAIAAPQRRSGWKVAAMWLLLLAACAIFAAAYLWKTDSRFKSKVENLLATVGEAAPVAETPPPLAQTVQARVDAALMIPVFQLSNELALLPARRSANGAGLKSDSVAMRESKAQGGVKADVAARARKTGQAKPAPPKKKPAQKESDSQSKPAASSKQAQTTVSRLAKSTEPAATVNPVVIKRSGEVIEPKVSGQGRPAADARSIAAQSEEPEEVVILADLTSSPIERQARALTSYERAENAFLKGVAHLRQGRMNDAEASFRSAIVEDRSHASARQALVGILIEAGRNADAEAVLVEALGVNPRQPQQAMILARLQVERGDLETAVLTLERARDYATNDASFVSFHAAVLQRATRHDEAAAQYRNALALVQGNAIWSMGLGISLRALGDTVGAKDAFRTAASAGTLNKELQAFVQQQFLQLNRAAR